VGVGKSESKLRFSGGRNSLQNKKKKSKKTSQKTNFREVLKVKKSMSKPKVLLFGQKFILV
jgi:hypothetical protein